MADGVFLFWLHLGQGPLLTRRPEDRIIPEALAANRLPGYLPQQTSHRGNFHPERLVPTPAGGFAIQARRREIRATGRPETEMEALFGEERDRMTRLLGSPVLAGRVGVFEGAMYQAKGYYRSQADCIMFTRDEVGFCAACRRAIDRVIDMYARH